MTRLECETFEMYLQRITSLQRRRAIKMQTLYNLDMKVASPENIVSEYLMMGTSRRKTYAFT